MAVSPVDRLLWITGLVVVIVPHVDMGSLSDYKICGNSGCESPMSRVQAIRDHRGKDCRFLSFRRGDTISVYHKLTGRREDLWAGTIDKQFGYFPKDSVKEEQVYATVEKVVETQRSDFFCMDKMGYPIDSSDLDSEDEKDDQKNQIQESESTHTVPHADGTNTESPSPAADPSAGLPVPPQQPENAGDAAAGTQGWRKEVQDNLAAAGEQGGSPSSSWLGSSVTGWLGFGKEEESVHLAEEVKDDERKETQSETFTASVTGWLGFGGEGKLDDTVKSGEDDQESANLLTSTMTGWLDFRGEAKTESAKPGQDGKRETEDEKEPEVTFRSRRMSLDLEGSRLHEEEAKEIATLEWLGGGLSRTLGFGATTQESGSEADADREAQETTEEEKEKPLPSWFGIGNILGFGKDESGVDESTQSRFKDQDRTLERESLLENIDTSQTHREEDKIEPDTQRLEEKPEVERKTKVGDNSVRSSSDKDKKKSEVDEQDQVHQLEIAADTTAPDENRSNMTDDSGGGKNDASTADQKDISPRTAFKEKSQVGGGMSSVTDEERSAETEGEEHQALKLLAHDRNREPGKEEIKTDLDSPTQPGISVEFSSEDLLPDSVGEVEGDERRTEITPVEIGAGCDGHGSDGSDDEADALRREMESSGKNQPHLSPLAHGVKPDAEHSETPAMVDNNVETEKHHELGGEGEVQLGLFLSEEEIGTTSSSESAALMENSKDQESMSPQAEQTCTKREGDVEELKETEENLGNNLQQAQTEKETFNFEEGVLIESVLKAAVESEKEAETGDVDLEKEKQDKELNVAQDELKEEGEIGEEELQQEKEEEKLGEAEALEEKEKQQEAKEVQEEQGGVEELEKERRREELMGVEEVKEKKKEEQKQVEESNEEEEKWVMGNEEQQDVKEIQEEGKQEEVEELNKVEEVKEEEKQGEVEEIREKEKTEEMEKEKQELDKTKEVEELEEERRQEELKEVEEIKEADKQDGLDEIKEKEVVKELKQAEGEKQEKAVELTEEKQEVEVGDLKEGEKKEEIEEVKEERKQEDVEELLGEVKREETGEVKEERKEEEVGESKGEEKQEAEVGQLLKEEEKTEEVEELKGETEQQEVEKGGEVDEAEEKEQEEVVEELKETEKQQGVKDMQEEVEEVKEEGKQTEIIEEIEGTQTQVDSKVKKEEQVKVEHLQEANEQEEMEEEKRGEVDEAEEKMQELVDELKEKQMQIIEEIKKTQTQEEFVELKVEEEEQLKVEDLQEAKKQEEVEEFKEEEKQENVEETKQREANEIQEGKQEEGEEVKEERRQSELNEAEEIKEEDKQKETEEIKEKQKREMAEELKEVEEEKQQRAEELEGETKQEEVREEEKKEEVAEAKEEERLEEAEEEERELKETQQVNEGEDDKRETKEEEESLECFNERCHRAPGDEAVRDRDEDGSTSADEGKLQRGNQNINPGEVLTEPSEEMERIRIRQEEGEDGLGVDWPHSLEKSLFLRTADNREDGHRYPGDLSEDKVLHQEPGDAETGSEGISSEADGDVREGEMDEAATSERDPAGPLLPTTETGALGLFRNAFGFFRQAPVTETRDPVGSRPSTDTDASEASQTQSPRVSKRELSSDTDRNQADEQELHTHSPVGTMPTEQPQYASPSAHIQSSTPSLHTETPLRTRTLSRHYSNLPAYMSMDEATILTELFGMHKLQFLDYMLGSSGSAREEPDHDESILSDVERLLRYHMEMLAAPGTRLADAPREDEEKTRTLGALQKLDMLITRVRETSGKSDTSKGNHQAEAGRDGVSTHGKDRELSTQEDSRMTGGPSVTPDNDNIDGGCEGEHSPAASRPHNQSGAPEPLKGLTERIMDIVHRIAEESATHARAAGELVTRTAQVGVIMTYQAISGHL